MFLDKLLVLVSIVLYKDVRYRHVWNIILAFIQTWLRTQRIWQTEFYFERALWKIVTNSLQILRYRRNIHIQHLFACLFAFGCIHNAFVQYNDKWCFKIVIFSRLYWTASVIFLYFILLHVYANKFLSFHALHLHWIKVD